MTTNLWTEKNDLNWQRHSWFTTLLHLNSKGMICGFSVFQLFCTLLVEWLRCYSSSQRSSLLSFSSWWLLILCDIVSGMMQFSDWSADPHTLLTQLRDIPLVVLAQTWYELLFIYLWITQYVVQCQGFSTFFSPLRTCGINRFFWLDSPTLILLVSAERRKRKMGVSAWKHTAAEGH